MAKTLLTAVALLIWATYAQAQGQGQSPGARIPAGANAVLTIDVQKFVQSPLGKQQDLQAKLTSAYADRPLAVPATARRLAIGAAVHPVGMKSIWQVAVIELSGTPRLEPMLRAQGGYLDKIENHEAAWTPRDAFYIVLDDHTLGVARPAQRQLIRRWLSGKGMPAGSPYITNALSKSGGADALLVVDLDDFVGLPALRYAAGMGQLPSLEAIDQGQDALMTALASVRGMNVAMRVTDKINADWVIDFDQSVAALGDNAKPFVIDVMKAADLYEPGLDQWTFAAKGNQIVGTGPMELDGLNRLIALLSPVQVGEADAASGEESATVASAGDAPAPAADPQKQAAQASQNYYRAVAKKLDTIGTRPSPSQSASWLVAQARAIEQLPVLNVDPALLEWGNAVADVFNRGAQELALGQQKALVASQRVDSPVGYASHTESGQGSSNSSPETRAAYRNAQKERREVAQAERGAAAERAFNILNQILPTRGKIRAEMVQKYGVEF